MAKKRDYVVKLTAVASIQMATHVTVTATSLKKAKELAIEQAKEESVDFEPDVWDDNDVDLDTIEAMDE